MNICWLINLKINIKIKDKQTWKTGKKNYVGIYWEQYFKILLRFFKKKNKCFTIGSATPYVSCVLFQLEVTLWRNKKWRLLNMEKKQSLKLYAETPT